MQGHCASITEHSWIPPPQPMGAVIVRPTKHIVGALRHQQCTHPLLLPLPPPLHSCCRWCLAGSLVTRPEQHLPPISRCAQALPSCTSCCAPPGHAATHSHTDTAGQPQRPHRRSTDQGTSCPAPVAAMQGTSCGCHSWKQVWPMSVGLQVALGHMTTHVRVQILAGEHVQQQQPTLSPAAG